MRIWPLLLLCACGDAPLRLPAALPASSERVRPGDAEAGERALADRKLGRSGWACVDCHPLQTGAWRPAPALAGLRSEGPFWSGAARTADAAIDRCVERFLQRPPLGGSTWNLIAALRATPPLEERLPEAPAGLYDAACRHCHEAGPAGALLGRRWSRRALERSLSGPQRRAPPAMMPGFELPEGARSALVEWLLRRPPGDVGKARESW